MATRRSRILPLAALFLAAATLPSAAADSSRSTQSDGSRVGSGDRARSPARRTGRSPGALAWRTGPVGWFRSGLPGIPLPRRLASPPGRASAPGRDRALRPTFPTVVPGAPARLALDVAPAGASVYLDGDWIGRAADLRRAGATVEVLPGRHELVVGHSERGSRRLVLELSPEEERRVVVHLEPTEPVTPEENR